MAILAMPAGNRTINFAGKGVLNVLGGVLLMLFLPFYSYDSVALTPGCKLSSFYHLSYNYLFFKCTQF